MNILKTIRLFNFAAFFLIGAVIFALSQNGFSAPANYSPNDLNDNFAAVKNFECCSGGIPFQKSVSLSFGGTVSGNYASIAIPAGKLLVIEQISALGSPRVYRQYEIDLRTNLDTTNYFTLNINRTATNGAYYYSVSQQVTLYSKSSMTILVTDTTSRAAGEAIPNATFNFSVSGYLVDESSIGN